MQSPSALQTHQERGMSVMLSSRTAVNLCRVSRVISAGELEGHLPRKGRANESAENVIPFLMAESFCTT